MKQQIKLPKIREQIKETDRVDAKHIIMFLVCFISCISGIVLCLMFSDWLDLNPYVPFIVLAVICVVLLKYGKKIFPEYF